MPLPVNVVRVARSIGKSHFEQLVNWLPSAAKYGVVGGLGLIWITDWKLVGQYIPYWGGRLKDKSE